MRTWQKQSPSIEVVDPMKRTELLFEIAGLSFSSLFLGLLLSYLAEKINIFQILLFSLASGSLVYVILLLKRRIARFYRKREFRDELIRSMHSLLYYRVNGMPLVSSIEKVAELAETESLKSSFSLISKRIRLGEMLENPIASITEIREIIPRLGNGTGILDSSTIKSALRSYALAMQEKVSLIEAHAQRGATINMFVSTILPSFIIFTFIGATIISNSTPDILLFSIAMLIALPIVYAVSFAELSRGLLE